MHKKLIVFIAGVVVTILCLAFTWEGIFKKMGVVTELNYIFYDTNLRLFHKNSASNKVVIVDVDNKSLKFDGRWPWSRNKIASIVKNLQDSGAAVIVFDILFPEKEPNIIDVLLDYSKEKSDVSIAVKEYLAKQLSYFDNDKILADAIAQSDVVLGEFFNNSTTAGEIGKPILSGKGLENLVILKMTQYVGNIPILVNNVKYNGFTTTLPDEDGDIRRSPLLLKYHGNIYPSLGLEAVRSYLLIDDISLDLRDFGNSKIFLGVKLGDIYIPTDMAGNMLINYIGPAFTFPYVSASDVIQNKFSSDVFEGKIVIIGSSTVGIGDIHSVPLQSIGYPGIEIHANIIESILSGDIISSPLWLVGVERVFIVVVGMVFTVFAAYFSILGLLLLTVTMLLFVFGFNAMLLVKWQWVLPHMMLPYLQVVLLGIINAGYGYLFEKRYRKRIHDTYGQYVSSEHIDKLLESQGGKATLISDTKVMTVLFADVRSFTSIAERLDADSVKKFLNTLFTPLTEIIFDNKGTIDKYVGDMIMAFWNDPIDDPDHAANAVKSALLMQKKVKELTPVFAAQSLSDIEIRIGINTGMMHVGDMGSKYRMAYTVLGDSVNLASRLESASKLYGTEILVSDATKERCKNIVFRYVDCIYVKGKVKPTNIYEPLCLLSKKTNSLEQELGHYKKALEFYDHDDWTLAKQEFANLMEIYPEVKLYEVYFKRVSEYEVNPPGKDWDRGQHLLFK